MYKMSEKDDKSSRVAEEQSDNLKLLVHLTVYSLKILEVV